MNVIVHALVEGARIDAVASVFVVEAEFDIVSDFGFMMRIAGVGFTIGEPAGGLERYPQIALLVGGRACLARGADIPRRVAFGPVA